MSVSSFDDIKIGTILYSKHPKLVKTDQPHYFICVAIDLKSDPSKVFSVVATSQMKKKIDYFKAMALPHDELVFLSPSSKNGFTKECCTSCRETFTRTRDEIDAKLKKGEIVHKGDLEEVYLEQILIGVKKSRKVDDNIKKLIPDFYGK